LYAVMIRLSSSHMSGKVTDRDAPDIRPDNPAFFDIRYPAGYQIVCRISGKAGYRIFNLITISCFVKCLQKSFKC
jgi:hypothetical protein